MDVLEKIFLEFLQTSMTGSIVILICFFSMKICINHIGIRLRLGIRLRYALFLLIILRLLIPGALHVDISSIFNKANQNEASISTINETSNKNIKPKTIRVEEKIEINKTEVDTQIDDGYKELFKSTVFSSSIVWVSGAMIVISVVVLCSLRFKYKLKKTGLIFDRKINLLSNELKSNLGIKRSIPVYISGNVGSACITGIISSKIYIPEFMLDLKKEDIEYILLHELMHYKRKDLYFNIIVITALAIHWFNPLVWILVNEIRNYREYACDSGVLEFLGEEKNISYGMTLINFSKLFIKKSDYLRLAIGFETNNKIRERIKMIKGFKKGSYKISVTAALGCLVAATVVFTNGVNVMALDTNNLTETNINQSGEVKGKVNPFIIDEEIKAYSDISKIVKYAGFNFKLPDYIVDGNKPASYQLLKLSDTSNAALIYFDGQGNDYSNNFSLTMFNGDVEKSLERVNEIKGRSRNNAEYKCDEEEKTLGNVNGKVITLNAKIPEYKIDDENIIPASEEIMNYFVWEDNGVCYALSYNKSTKKEGNSDRFSDGEIEKVVQSFKNIDEVKNVDYKRNIREDEALSTELGLMSIYDKDDLNEAAKILGFNPKMPLKVGDNVIVDGSGVGLTGDSDIENKKLNYELNLFYTYGKNRITFNQSSHDSFNVYKGIKENGYVDQSDQELAVNKQIKVDKIDIDGKTVYKYLESFNNLPNDKTSNDIYYIWEENGMYCSLVLFDTDNYQDDIAKEFVNSKCID